MAGLRSDDVDRLDIGQPHHQVEAAHIGQTDIGNDGVVAIVGRKAANHELGFAAVVGRFDDAALPFQQIVGGDANILISIDNQNPSAAKISPVQTSL